MTGASPGPQEMSPRTFSQVSDFGKNSGKYLPYANVDTFLKTCTKVGLTDVEVFTPPDAVESKDIRRVCTSIRSLTKKARAQHIRVLDFEDVNRPLPMPKDKIVGIKENLQHSHSSPVTPKAATPEANIIKSERVQIISTFLSSTNPLYSPDDNKSSRNSSERPSPFTPGSLKSPSMKDSSVSTPTTTIGGIDTPLLTKSTSVIEPPIASSPSPSLSMDQPYDSSSPFSRKALGSFRHAQPHFIKKSSSQTNIPDQVDDPPLKSPAPHPRPETTPSSPAVSATSTTASTTPSTPAVADPSTPTVAKISMSREHPWCFCFINAFGERNARKSAEPLGTSVGGDWVYGVCAAMEREKDPRCFFVAFHLVERLALSLPASDVPLADFAEDLFDIVSRYFPVSFIPPPNDTPGISRDDLAEALLLDSLRYLGLCALSFGLESVSEHLGALWLALKAELIPLAHDQKDAQIHNEALICLTRCVEAC